jgi:hypothetical protein
MDVKMDTKEKEYEGTVTLIRPMTQFVFNFICINF